MADGVKIEVCAYSELKPALTLVLRSLPADHRAPLVDSLSRLMGEPLGPFQALVVAKRGEELLAAAWGQPQPGKGCSLWPPQAQRGEPPVGLATELVERVVAIADDAGAAITQTLTETLNSPLHASLLQCGFQEVAQLHYLQWTPSSSYPQPRDRGIGFVPFQPKHQRRLERLIARTYDQTLDFPELDGMRDVRDVVTGYRCAGEFQPELWQYLTLDGEEAGALLLAEFPETRQLELVYMGIVPEARGRGIGAVAVSRAQAIALDRCVERMVLAVDVRNKPARDIYHRAGFRQWAERYAYLRPRGGRPSAG